MGRVYNALVKADRWKDRGRPIGRPADFDERPPLDEQGSRGAGEQGSSYQPSAISHQPSAVSRQPSAGSNQPSATTNPQSAIRGSLKTISRATAPQSDEPRRSVNLSKLDVEPHLATLTGGDVLARERYRTLAVRLINMAARRKLKTLLVTSAREGEGKTTVATSLAWVMAKPVERRVLLIDADLSHPSIARRLGVTSERGWLDLLEGRAELKDAALRIDPNGLYLLTPSSSFNGSASRDYTEMGRAEIQERNLYADVLTSRRIEDLLEDFEQRFDFVIIDAPPILELADAQRLASVTDGTVLVTSAGYTHHSQVTDAIKFVPKDRRLGVVLNGAQVEDEIAYHSRKKRSTFGPLFGRKR